MNNELLRAKIPGDSTNIHIEKTVCGICGPSSHCGIDAYIKDGVILKVEGSKDNPNSLGTLCAKGASSRQYIYHKDRLLYPMYRKKDKKSQNFEAISWDNAYEIIATCLCKIKNEFGPESTVFYSGYPKWYRPFLQRLAHSFGSPNYCSESSTCSHSVAMANRLNFGFTAKPDIINAKCLLNWSGNPFYSNTTVARRLLDAKESGLKIIDVGPLITPLTAHADIHLRLRPGTSGALALGMAHIIIQERLYDSEFIESWAYGFDEYREYVEGFTPEKTEKITNVPADLIVKASRMYALERPAAMSFSPSSVVHHTNGLQNQRAVSLLIALTGNLDRKGGNHVVPLSYYHVSAGIPTRHDEFALPGSFDDMPPRVGQDIHPVFCKLVNEAQSMHLPFQIQTQQPYPIKAMIAFGINHRMWPGSDFMADSLKKLEFFTVVDIFMTDTAKMADLVLPACTSFERSELKIYPQQSVIWTHPIINPLGESRSDAEIIQDMARCLGINDPLLRQGHEAWLDWILEPSGIEMSELKNNAGKYLYKGPVHIPYEKYIEKGFPTSSGKIEFSSISLKEAGIDPLPIFKEPELSPVSSPDTKASYPLILTTGARLPMFLHSQLFRLPWTKKLRKGHPSADINPEDAKYRNILQGDEIILSTMRSSIRVKANLTEIVPPGVVNMYHAFPSADVNSLISPDYRDPVSGFPGFKSLLCQVSKASSSPLTGLTGK